MILDTMNTADWIFGIFMILLVSYALITAIKSNRK